MKHLFKNIILSLFAILWGINANAFDFEYKGLYFNILSDSTCEVTFKDSTFNSYSGMKIVPKTAIYDNGNYKVVRIGEKAFRNCKALNKVVLQDGIVSIGSAAFYLSSSITAITMPSSVKTIEEWAFCNCTNLASIKLSEGLTDIGNYAFSECTELASISLPNSLKSIGNDCFSNCIYEA